MSLDHQHHHYHYHYHSCPTLSSSLSYLYHLILSNKLYGVSTLCKRRCPQTVNTLIIIIITVIIIITIIIIILVSQIRWSKYFVQVEMPPSSQRHVLHPSTPWRGWKVRMRMFKDIILKIILTCCWWWWLWWLHPSTPSRGWIIAIIKSILKRWFFLTVYTSF